MNFQTLVATVDFSSIWTVVLWVAGALITVECAWVGYIKIREAITGVDVVEYGGRAWDSDVYDTAMQNLEKYKKRGGRLDSESAQKLAEWRDEKARSGLF